MPYRDSPHHEIETVMSFKYLNLLKTNEHTEKNKIRKPNVKNFLFENEVKKYFYVGEKLLTFETNDKIVKYTSEHGFNDINTQMLMVRKTFTSCYIGNTFLFKKMKLQQGKIEYQYLY